MEFLTKKSFYPVITIFALGGLAFGCSSGSNTDSVSSEKSATSASPTSSASAASSSSKIDEKLMVTVECVITKVDTDDIINMEDVSATEALLTLKADSYFYYDEIVTVTNYTESAEDVYVQYRLMDATGKVFNTSNFLEVVNAGETITLTENKINNPPRDIVFRGDTSKKKSWFDCPVVEAAL